MTILINLHRLQISLLIALVTGALGVIACSDAEPSDDLSDTAFSTTEQSSDAGGLPHVGDMDVVPWYASPDDNDEEESWECIDISDSDECKETYGCLTYRTLKIDQVEIAESDMNCRDYHREHYANWADAGDAVVEFCVTGAMTEGDSLFGSTFARYNTEADEYEIYIFWNLPSSQDTSENGFRSCHSIPADEYPEDRELCFECRGSTDPEAD